MKTQLIHAAQWLVHKQIDTFLRELLRYFKRVVGRCIWLIWENSFFGIMVDNQEHMSIV